MAVQEQIGTQIGGRDWCKVHNHIRSSCGFWVGYPHGEGPNTATTPATAEDDPMKQLKQGVTEILTSFGLNEEQLPGATGQIVALLQRFTVDTHS